MEEIIQKFGINWKLLLAQAVNFGILFFILKKFVYSPLISLLHKRKEDIEKGIEFSKKAEENLKNADLHTNKTLKEAKEKALGIVTDAEGQANLNKEEILKEAMAKREGLVAEARVIIDEHKNKMLEGAYNNAEGFLRLALEKVLGRMPASERDNQLIKEALKEARSVRQ